MLFLLVKKLIIQQFKVVNILVWALCPFAVIVFIDNLEKTITAIQQQKMEARKLTFLKYKQFFSLGTRKFCFPKY